MSSYRNRLADLIRRVRRAALVPLALHHLPAVCVRVPVVTSPACAQACVITVCLGTVCLGALL